jgi:hypothetical protein
MLNEEENSKRPGSSTLVPGSATEKKFSLPLTLTQIKLKLHAKIILGRTQRTVPGDGGKQVWRWVQL